MKKGEKKSEYQKLLDLLNEYEDPMVSWYSDYIEPAGMFVLNNNKQGTCEEVIISKNFWFIKWLVENEKIDFEWKLNTLRFEGLVNQVLDSSLALYMLLSIQDEPINFLNSILK